MRGPTTWRLQWCCAKSCGARSAPTLMCCWSHAGVPMSTFIASTTCPICLGERFADPASVTDAKRNGRKGGRITCHCGATNIWLTEFAAPPRPEFVFNRYEHDARATRKIRCERCRCWTPTRGSHTKRCIPCRDEVKRERAREASRRHVPVSYTHLRAHETPE